MTLELLLNQLDVARITQHVEWLTRNTPNRMSGSGQDTVAAEYIADAMRRFGLEAGVCEFEAYNSSPGVGSLEIVTPGSGTVQEVACQPCAHVASTPPSGIEAELVYVGAGGELDYRSLDVRGKIVLADVSYSPPTPEKARIAWRNGALGIVLSNWGTDSEDVICMRALKGVWGNPTIRTFAEIPQIAGVTVSRPWGDRLASLCSRGPVRARLVVSCPRKWERLAQPYGVLRSSAEPDRFVLVSAHLDAWEPGVTCNATGDATALELARVLANNSARLRRSVHFAFWNGHEIAEAAGSTWFVDTYWPRIARDCVAYMNIDSTGMKGATVLRVSASRELLDMVKEVSRQVVNGPVEVHGLSRTGDQSFFGVGVPAISARYSFPDEYVRRTRGATLGWWNHTPADTLDKYDPEVVERDARIQCAYLWRLVTSRRLPLTFSPVVQEAVTAIERLEEPSQGIVDLAPIRDDLSRLGRAVSRLDSLDAGSLSDVEVDIVNRVCMRLSRVLTNAFHTCAGRFEQDSYGLSVLSNPVPLLHPVTEMADMDRSTERFRLLRTELLRARNRVWDAVDSALYSLEDALDRLGDKGR